MDRAAPTADHHTRWIIAGALAVLVLACFWPVATFDFVNYDDNRYLTANPIVQRGWSAEGWAYSWTSLDGGYWHPLTWWSHLTDTTLFGMDARGHHVTSLVIHLANTLLLWWVLLRYTGAIWLSAWAAAIFAVHPMHVESVAWISERKDLTSGLFVFLTLLAYKRYTERPAIATYLLVSVSLAAALMSKPMAVTTPAVLLLLDLWPLKRLATPLAAGFSRSEDEKPAASGVAKQWTRCIVEKLPWFAMAIAAGLYTIRNTQSVESFSSTEAVPLALRVQTMIVGYGWYVGKLLAPAKLSLFYPYPSAWPLWKLLAAAGALLAISGVAVWQFRRRPAVLVGWCLFLGVMFPISGLFVVGDAFAADRYTYLPYVGLLLAMAWGLALPRRLLVVAGVASVLACAVLTAKHVWVWQNSRTVWANALRSDPGNWTANFYYAIALAVSGDEEEAGTYFKRAVEAEPQIPTLNANYARWLLDRGRIPEAETYITVAGAVDASSGDFLSVAGRLEWHHGRPDVAAPMLARATVLLPIGLEPRVYLGLCLIDLGKLSEAEQVLHEALQYEPNDAAALHGLARIAQRRGQPGEAGRLYQRAIAAKPAAVEPRLDYAEMAVDANAVQEAGGQVAAVESLAAASLQRARAELLRGSVLEAIGRPMDAARSFLKSLELYRAAIAVDPADPRARYQLAVALQQTGQADAALAAAREAMSAAVAADHRVIQGQLRARFPAAAATQPTSRPSGVYPMIEGMPATASVQDKLLQRAGLRRTPVRLGVLSLLAAAKAPMDVPQILAKLPGHTDAVTVYRTLNTFTRKKLVHRIRGEDRSWRYALGSTDAAQSEHRHPHFVCENCGKVECLKDADIPASFTRALGVPPRYRVSYPEVVLHGICPRCSA